MPFSLSRQDITTLSVDAIVNAANPELRQGGGVCGAIFAAAGAEQLQAACAPLAPIRTGEAVITPGFGLPARWIIHAAGPVYDARNPDTSRILLRATYTHALQLAVAYECQSIAFPLISSGIYGYPRTEALQVAVDAIRSFLEEHELDVILVVLSKDTMTVSRSLLEQVEHYLAGHLTRMREESPPQFRQSAADHMDQAVWEAVPGRIDLDDERPRKASRIRKREKPKAAADTPEKELSELLVNRIRNLDEPFSTTLMRLIDARGLSDVAVYKRANLDRKLFSKIRSGRNYMPSKRTAIALAIALELNLSDTADLLARAGYTLSSSQIFDVIIEYFILHRQFDIYAINEVLFRYDQPLLGG